MDVARETNDLYLHVRVGRSISHGQIVRVVIQRMNVQPVLCRSSSQLAQHICDMLLLVDREIILRGAKEDDASFTNCNSEVAKLLLCV